MGKIICILLVSERKYWHPITNNSNILLVQTLQFLNHRGKNFTNIIVIIVHVVSTYIKKKILYRLTKLANDIRVMEYYLNGHKNNYCFGQISA